jgi:uncharacterized membrane protein YhaH (DUF805 family)
MDFVNIFISFSGRINRAKYWIAVLIFTAINLVFVALAYLASQSTALHGVKTAVGIATMISGIAVAIKRLHDRNKSGWFVLLFVVAPAILLGLGLAIGTMSTGSDFIATALWLIAIVIGVWSFVELGCLRGTIGRNKYGSDPLAPEVLTPPVRTHA